MSASGRPTVYLHVGTPKSGTTSVQAALDHNRHPLADEGVLYPGESSDQIRGAREVLGQSRSARHWEDLARQARAFSGRSVVISMESLCTAQPRHARRAVRAFGDLDVQVVITARDLARSIPAQWQESTQFRHTWSYRDYLDGVTAARPRRTPAGRSFWRQHDLPQIIRVWARAVGAENITVVTLPQRSEPNLLWRRFAEVVGIDPVRAAVPETRNESLGAASAELMRRVNASIADLGLTMPEYASNCRRVLAKTVLATRSRDEPKLTLPSELQQWAVRRSGRLVDSVRASGVSVAGDLADLQSTGAATSPDTDPEQLPADDVLDAAVHAIVGLVDLRARQQRTRRARRQRQTPTRQ